MNTKPFFSESETDLVTPKKLTHSIRVFYKFILKSVKSLTRTLWAMEHWFNDSEYQICSMNTKPFFWERKTNLGTLQKLCRYIEVSCKYILKYVKSLNGKFWAMEYCFWGLEWQIWNTNTQPFLWKSKKNPGNLWKRSCNIGVSYKFVLKSVKSWNRIFWAMEHWFKALEC